MIVSKKYLVLNYDLVSKCQELGDTIKAITQLE